MKVVINEQYNDGSIFDTYHNIDFEPIRENGWEDDIVCPYCGERLTVLSGSIRPIDTSGSLSTYKMLFCNKCEKLSYPTWLGGSKFDIFKDLYNMAKHLDDVEKPFYLITNEK